MTKMKKDISLQGEIRRGQFIVTITVLLTCGFALVFSNWLISIRSANRTAQATASILSRNLVAPLLFRDLKEAQKTLSSLEDHPSFRGCLVLDLSNNIIAKFPDALPPTETIQKNWPEYDIQDHGERLARLILIPRREILAQDVLQYAVVILAVLLIAYFISLFASRATKDKIDGQIKNILQTTRAIRQQSNYTLRVQSATLHRENIAEIQALANDFNGMLATIETRDREIAGMNSGLEAIVEQRTAELREAQVSLVQSSRLSALGEMSASLAHEINNPLAIIDGKARMIKKSLQSMSACPADVIPGIERIESMADRIAKIIRGLRTMSRDGSGDPFEKVKLQSILNDALDLSSAKMKTRGIEVEVEPFDSEIMLDCRATQIGQVLLNLLNNAGDAIEKLSEKWVKVGIQLADARVVIAITDSGPGIPEEIRAKLMQPFFTTKAVGKGTGLGLSISRKIVEAHGGTFEIDASAKNTRFVIKLPLQRV